jgi:hypothetical protein
MQKVIVDFATGERTVVDLTAEEIADAQARTAAEAAGPKRWTSLEFIERFTESEQIAIVTAAQSSAALRLWYDKAMAADFINSDDPRTVDGMAVLVSVGLLTSERRDEILGVA